MIDEDSISCDFENDYICGYKNRNDNDIKWKRYVGKSESTETGPLFGLTY